MSTNPGNIHLKTVSEIKAYKTWFGTCDCKLQWGELFKCNMKAMVQCIIDSFALVDEFNEEQDNTNVSSIKVTRLSKIIGSAPPGVIVSITAQSLLDHKAGIKDKNVQYFIDLKNKIASTDITDDDTNHLSVVDDSLTASSDFYTVLGELFEEGYLVLKDHEDPRGQLAMDRLWCFARNLVYCALQLKVAGVDLNPAKTMRGGAF